MKVGRERPGEPMRARRQSGGGWVRSFPGQRASLPLGFLCVGGMRGLP